MVKNLGIAPLRSVKRRSRHQHAISTVVSDAFTRWRQNQEKKDPIGKITSRLPNSARPPPPRALFTLTHFIVYRHKYNKTNAGGATKTTQESTKNSSANRKIVPSFIRSEQQVYKSNLISFSLIAMLTLLNLKRRMRLDSTGRTTDQIYFKDLRDKYIFRKSYPFLGLRALSMRKQIIIFFHQPHHKTSNKGWKNSPKRDFSSGISKISNVQSS